MKVNELSEMLGATMSRVEGERGSGTMVFYADDGREFRFYHSQECCESVEIEDVCGDLSDLVGSPFVLAEEVSSESAEPPRKDYLDSYTWTFYRFGTAKGTVTVRWLGESNGYYSESVNFEVVASPAPGEEPKGESRPGTAASPQHDAPPRRGAYACREGIGCGRGRPLNMSTLPTAVEEFKRAKLDELLADCTESQRALFARIFPSGVPADKLDSAFALCERTVEANRKKAAGST